MFEESLNSKESVTTYTYHVKKFMKYYSLQNYDKVISFDKTILQQMVERYVIYLKRTVGANSISTYANPIKTFFEVNDIDLN